MGNFSFFLSSADFILLFKTILSGTLSECQTVLIQIRTLSESKLFPRVIRRGQKLPLARICLFGLFLYVPVNNFLIILGRVFLG